MTSRNIKTILFASLIAAMILPFSMMDNAVTQENQTRQKTLEHINEKIDELSSGANAASENDTNEKLKALKYAKKFLKAKENNDTEKMNKFSKKLQELIPEGTIENLPEATPETGNMT